MPRNPFGDQMKEEVCWIFSYRFAGHCFETGVVSHTLNQARHYLRHILVDQGMHKLIPHAELFEPRIDFNTTGMGLGWTICTGTPTC